MNGTSLSGSRTTDSLGPAPIRGGFVQSIEATDRDTVHSCVIAVRCGTGPHDRRRRFTPGHWLTVVSDVTHRVYSGEEVRSNPRAANACDATGPVAELAVTHLPDSCRPPHSHKGAGAACLAARNSPRSRGGVSASRVGGPYHLMSTDTLTSCWCLARAGRVIVPPPSAARP